MRLRVLIKILAKISLFIFTFIFLSIGVGVIYGSSEFSLLIDVVIISILIYFIFLSRMGFLRKLVVILLTMLFIVYPYLIGLLLIIYLLLVNRHLFPILLYYVQDIFNRWRVVLNGFLRLRSEEED